MLMLVLYTDGVSLLVEAVDICIHFLMSEDAFKNNGLKANCYSAKVVVSRCVTNSVVISRDHLFYASKYFCLVFTKPV